MDSIFEARIISILSAMMFSIGNLFLRYGLRTSTPITATVTLALVTLALFAPFAVYNLRSGNLSPVGGLVLVAGGIASPGLSRTFLTMSFERIGLSRSVTISNAAPLVAVVLGVLFLEERPDLPVYAGTIAIIAGISCLTKEPAPAGPERPVPRSAWYNYTLALLATLTLGIAATLRKVGVALVPDLSAALSLATFGSLAVVLAWYPLLPPGKRLKAPRKGIGCFLLSALFTCLAQLGFFAALQRGALSVVMPLVCTVPLFTLLWSWLFLRKVERVTVRIALGALLVSGGAALITVA